MTVQRGSLHPCEVQLGSSWSLSSFCVEPVGPGAVVLPLGPKFFILKLWSQRQGSFPCNLQRKYTSEPPAGLSLSCRDAWLLWTNTSTALYASFQDANPGTFTQTSVSSLHEKQESLSYLLCHDPCISWGSWGAGPWQDENKEEIKLGSLTLLMGRKGAGPTLQGWLYLLAT